MADEQKRKRDYLMAFSDFGRQLPSSPHQHPYFAVDGEKWRRAGPAQTVAEFQGETHYVSEPDRVGIKIWNGPVIATDLSDIVSAIADNNLIWLILDYEGTGPVFASKSWRDNEDQLGSDGSGLSQSWAVFKQFAAGVQSTTDALVVAAASFDDVNLDEIRNGIYGSAELVIERFDNTYWVIACKRQSALLVDFNALLRHVVPT